MSKHNEPLNRMERNLKEKENKSKRMKDMKHYGTSQHSEPSKVKHFPAHH